jgi:hypothetical protein
MLSINGKKVEVRNPQAWNVVLMEERFDLSLPWAQAVPVRYTTRAIHGVKTPPPILAQSTDLKYPVYILTTRECSMRYQVRLAIVSYTLKTPPGKFGNRSRYHLQNFVRYLRLEKLRQREGFFQSWRSAIGERWR